MRQSRETIDIGALRGRLAGASGAQYWRSLEELAATPEFTEFLESEFPAAAPDHDGLGRRRFLQLMGASLALAGFGGGCTRQPPEKILPYVRAPEEILPGKPLFFATTIPLGGAGTGVLVESHMGRPTKIEGNPKHPSSLGATDARTQAAVLGLYDPDRSQVVTQRGSIRSWDSLVAALHGALERQGATQGAGLRILTETITSPTASGQLEAILAAYPEAAWYQYEPINRDGARAGALLAFGEDVETHYDLEKADVIVSLDADLLGSSPGAVRYARDFAARRKPDGAMNRLHAVESTPTITGAASDVRLAARPTLLADIVRALAARLGVKAAGEAPALPAEPARWVAAVASELEASRERSLVVAGDAQRGEVHALVHAINDALKNSGKTVIYTAPIVARSTDANESIRQLAADIDSGRVELLVIAGGNPAYTAPADLGFADLLLRVPLTLYLGLHVDETSRRCQWHIPATHPLESWGDALAHDGTASLLQPLIAPLYNGKTIHELLGALLGELRPSSHKIVQDHWRQWHEKSAAAGDASFESFWRRALHDGVIAGSAFPPTQPALRSDLDLSPARGAGDSPPALEVVFRPDPAIWDGRFANNGWLQEMPRPLTKLTWDNAACLSPSTAESLRLESGDLVELKLDGRTVEAPVWIQPGHADGCVTLPLGYGRESGGKVAEGAGFNAYKLRSSAAPRLATALGIRKTGRRYDLATTQHHHSMEGRQLVREADLARFREKPDFAREAGHETPEDLSLFPLRKYEDHRWGMVIDLNACTGCSACMIACQAENNIPVVGKPQVKAGRSMHWIRVDRYYKGDLDRPETVHQPVPCMQCENAPCELVCPVGATVHSSEGLNDMVYNRCVGTRYCANNCPYKVRRFNFFHYTDAETPSLALQRNPDVTVRSRGVMEKCTYCVQRINDARIQAKKEGRKVRDGEVVTACQGVCPSQAIVFGDLNDPQSQVARLRADPRNYGLLTQLNTRPRTTYLARVSNPPAAQQGARGKGG